MAYFDSHCHLFDSSIFNPRILELLGSAHDLMATNNRDRKAWLKKLKGIADTLEIVNSGGTEQVYQRLNQTYQSELCIMPLMFDLTFADDNNGNLLQNQLYKMRREAMLQIANTLFKFASTVFAQDHEIMELVELLQSPSFALMQVLKGKKDFFDSKSFEKQRDSLEQLVKDHPGLIYPFFGIDPRRQRYLGEDLNSMFRKKVLEPNGFWAGVKLYAPAGFSPTDPILMGRDNSRNSIYAICEDYGIPITVHCSNAGFATISERVRISGTIKLNGHLTDVEDEVVKLGKFFGIVKFGKAIKNRANILNHPSIWKKVLEKYPKLKINLAHFGGSGEIMDFVNYTIPEELFEYEVDGFENLLHQCSPGEQEIFNNSYTLIKKKIKHNSYYLLKEDLSEENRAKLWILLWQKGELDNWTKHIYDLLANPDYPNVYTDLSCFVETVDGVITGPLREFKEKIYDRQPEQIKSRILYGSDYWFNVMQGVPIETYYQNFREAFGPEFDKIASENPQNFLARKPI